MSPSPYKNLSLIQKQLGKRLFPAIFIMASLYAIFGHVSIALSFILGSSFSYLALYNMMISQSLILKKRTHKAFFISMIFRLGIYGLPIGIGFLSKGYLNLWIILISLWTFQVALIGFELRRSLKNIRKRQRG